jgi:type II secretory ATPase GspE/PulE/Tfp pilus assembly ATPase PilB-like protein
VGRVGIYEVLLIDAPLRALVESAAPTAEIMARLTPDNFVSAARYGRFLLTQGIVAPRHVADHLAMNRSLGGGF